MHSRNPTPAATPGALMSSRERIRRAVTFEGPDRIPTDLWELPAAKAKHGQALQAVKEEFSQDIGESGYENCSEEYRIYEGGRFTDIWGSTWQNPTPGVMGQVVEFPLDDWEHLSSFQPPFEHINKGFERVEDTIRAGDKFILAPTMTLFHRMNWLRNTADLYLDLAEGRREVFRLRDLIHEYNVRWVKQNCKFSFNAIGMGDDWGSQQSLLISPRMWREHFKPCYKELFDLAHEAGKLVFFHSDGYIVEIIEDLIEIGVDALNCQVWCMDPEELSRRFRGRLCFWGELDRQQLLPHGTPGQIRAAAQKMVDLFWTGGGGLIHQSEVGADVPLDNIRALLRAWKELRGTT